MARGFNATVQTLDAGEARPVAPIGASLDAATAERVYVMWLGIAVIFTGTGNCIVTDSATGQVLAQLDCSVPLNSTFKNYASGQRLYDGRALTPGSPLLATVTGGQVQVEVGYEVR